MTSITLLRASTALRTARVVVRSLGHGLDTRLSHGRAEHTRNTQRHAVRRDRWAIYTVAVAILWILPCILSTMSSRIRREIISPAIVILLMLSGNRYTHNNIIWNIVYINIYKQCNVGLLMEDARGIYTIRFFSEFLIRCNYTRNFFSNVSCKLDLVVVRYICKTGQSLSLFIAVPIINEYLLTKAKNEAHVVIEHIWIHV